MYIFKYICIIFQIFNKPNGKYLAVTTKQYYTPLLIHVNLYGISHAYHIYTIINVAPVEL